jgi:methionine synthase II (cobalamin-independent)
MCRDHWKLLPHATRAKVRVACEKFRAGELSADELRKVQVAATKAVLAKQRKGVDRG